MDQHRCSAAGSGMSVAKTSEQGASAVVIALSMLVIMGFAALAIDIGLGLNERRQDQAASDVGALAAVQFAQPNAGCSGASCVTQAATNGANEAITVANASLDDPSAADWTDSSRCGTPPAGFSVSPVTDCVAFTANFQRAWVKVPIIDSPTYFGRLLGADSLAVSADSIADQGFSNPGPVWPFLLPGNAASADYNCLKTGPNPAWGVCEDLPGTGNFGSMDFFIFGNQERNTTQKCTGDTNGRLVSNIARGIDHPLGLHPSGVGAGKEEKEVCPILGAEPDMADGQPGVGSALEDGLLYGGSSYTIDGIPYPGRIEDSSGFLVRDAQGSTPAARIDDTTLWSYLAGGLPGPCSSATVDTPQEMVSCIGWAKSTGTEIFIDDIIFAPRFGFTPGVWELDFLTPGSAYHIKEYRPVYMDTTYYGCTSSSCDIVHTVGVADGGPCGPDPEFVTCGTPGPGNKGLDAVAAYILDPSILPDVAKTPNPGAANQRSYALSE